MRGNSPAKGNQKMRSFAMPVQRIGDRDRPRETPDHWTLAYLYSFFGGSMGVSVFQSAPMLVFSQSVK